MEQSGVDPNSFEAYYNPFAAASYMDHRARAVTTNEEGRELVTQVGIDVGLKWFGRFTMTKNIKAQVRQVSQTSKILAGETEDIALVVCFAEGTLIATQDSLVAIQYIKKGNKVYAYDVENKSFVLSSVKKVSSSKTDKIIKVYYGKEIIFVTPEHLFFIDGQWKRAQDLRPNDQFTTKSNNYIYIDSINIVDTLIRVYNFEVRNQSTYCIGQNGIVVHNGPCDSQGVRAWIKHDVYNQVRNRFGKMGIDKFINSIKRGIVSAKGENGIKIINAKINGKMYQYELKIKGTYGDWRLYGNMDESSGHIIFSLFGKGIH